ncbi:MAG: hypothetical protein MI810_21160 [Flavobacteriales bacterium]|jgi:hypothetical protein|nr:hypothetical protein [Flavobacteriales bacterium]
MISSRIKTAEEALEHYLPKLLDRQMDIDEIRSELREHHRFSDQKLIKAIRLIENEAYALNQPNSFDSQSLFHILMGALIAFSGAYILYYLNQNGFLDEVRTDHNDPNSITGVVPWKYLTAPILMCIGGLTMMIRGIAKRWP